MRLLIAFEDSHNLYSDAMERAIRDSRPHLEIEIARTSELEAEIERFDPTWSCASGQTPRSRVAGGRG
jgi:hypothetical protein